MPSNECNTLRVRNSTSVRKIEITEHLKLQGCKKVVSENNYSN